MDAVDDRHRLDRASRTVSDAPLQVARRLIAEHHYSRGSSKAIVFMHGLYRADGELCGAAHWIPPTKPAAVSVNRDHWRDVLSLSRLVVLPGEPVNSASYLIGRSIRLIRAAGRWRTLLTYADESQGHTGAIYRATNWKFIGRTKPRRMWINPVNGRRMSQKCCFNLTKAEMLRRGYVQGPAYTKLKFVYHLA